MAKKSFIITQYYYHPILSHAEELQCAILIGRGLRTETASAPTVPSGGNSRQAEELCVANLNFQRRRIVDMYRVYDSC